jgi:hypothetical protein
LDIIGVGEEAPSGHIPFGADPNRVREQVGFDR